MIFDWLFNLFKNKKTVEIKKTKTVEIKKTKKSSKRRHLKKLKKSGKKKLVKLRKLKRKIHRRLRKKPVKIVEKKSLLQTPVAKKEIHEEKKLKDIKKDMQIGVSTKIDEILGILEEGPTDFLKLSKRLGTSENLIEEWVKVLEEHDLVEISYPPLGSPVVKLKA